MREYACLKRQQRVFVCAGLRARDCAPVSLFARGVRVGRSRTLRPPARQASTDELMTDGQGDAEHMEKLNATWCEMKKAIAVGDKILKQACAVTGAGKTFMMSRDMLSNAVEQAEIKFADLGFLVKFRKDRQGQKLCADMAKATQVNSVAVTRDLVDAGKQLRSLIPKIEES